MRSDQILRVEQLLVEAADLPRHEVGEFLASRCPDDVDVRAEVEHRLRAGRGEASSGRERPTQLATTESSALGPGTRVGPYRILRRIGEGGMGVVYEAEQETPIRRRVALKLIKWGMDTQQVVARFESERQSLALMSHPNIAAIYDGGATAEGRPYFAMEFVAGVPITDYCDRNRVSTSGRLRLFIEVCEGVQHAHQKGLIHRDLKPSNVLVEERDGRPVPKIIDFGVSKATSQRLAERGVFTELGQMIGTPEYMSPEQAEVTALDVDTRTDVYSLGVLLYELLVGVLPFDPSALRAAGFDEIRRLIRDVEPPKPSTRLSSLADSGESARRRHTDPSSLQRQLRGDLDWITMRALEKERGRRYASASELAADVSRHLRHEPILAGPPSGLYRARKFVRRHRFGVAATAVAVLALLGVAGALAVQAARIAQERDRANQEAASATRALGFIEELFVSADPSRTRGEEVTAREILDRGMGRVEDELGEEPEAAVRLLNTLGRVYVNLGLIDDADKATERAVANGQEHLGEANPYTVAALDEQGWIRYQQGRYDEAAALHERTLELNRRLHGEDHVDTATSMSLLGTAYTRQGRHEEAEQLQRKALDVRLRALGPSHEQTLESMSNLAIVLRLQGQYDEALELFRRVRDVRLRVNGEDHPQTLRVTNNMANVLAMSGRFEEAEELYAKTVELRLKVLGREHPETMMAMSNLATARDRLGRYEEAVAGHREVMELRTKVLGEDHPYTLMSKNLLADAYVGLGRFAESEALHRKVLEARRRLQGPDDPFTTFAMITLGNDYFAQGRYAEAERIYRETVDIRHRTLGDEHQETLLAWNNVALAIFKQGRLDEAVEMFKTNLDVQRRVLGERHPDVATSLYYLACCDAQAGRIESSIDFLTRSIDAGYPGAGDIADEEELTSLRGQPGFEALVERVRANGSAESAAGAPGR